MDEIHDSGYDKTCDLCLFDRHWCTKCQDIVGHDHWHDSDL